MGSKQDVFFALLFLSCKARVLDHGITSLEALAFFEIVMALDKE